MKPATAWPPVPLTYSIEEVLKEGWGWEMEEEEEEEEGNQWLHQRRGDLWSHTEWVLDSQRGGWKSGLRLSAWQQPYLDRNYQMRLWNNHQFLV